MKNINPVISAVKTIFTVLFGLPLLIVAVALISTLLRGDNNGDYGNYEAEFSERLEVTAVEIIAATEQTALPAETETTALAAELPAESDYSPPTKIVRFGGYDWRVLDVEDGKALLLSDNIIGARDYHEKWGSVSWETCMLREFLNDDFYNMFGEDDRRRIADSENVNCENQWYGTRGGADTTDKIFLLSLEEAVRYFGDSGQLADKPIGATAVDDRYNTARRAFKADKPSQSGDWRLRSPGTDTTGAAYVDGGGRVVVGGDSVRFNKGIRPALRLYMLRGLVDSSVPIDLHSMPTAISETLGEISGGALLYVIEYNPFWYFTEYNGEWGYVSAEYILDFPDK
jgi:hypothetical protein